MKYLGFVVGVLLATSLDGCIGSPMENISSDLHSAQKAVSGFDYYSSFQSGVFRTITIIAPLPGWL